ncbi:polyserase-related [Holotrichia oblita]|uniref:Polyserase-related n=1 Tax=Holotrichia oblita TaxID=644536 RepID=A0ACB9ST52_HOLOL|nr:polyserase-related [Holotrichia oblita]
MAANQPGIVDLYPYLVKFFPNTYKYITIKESVLFLVLLGVNASSEDNRIIGGDPVDIKDYPYQIALFYKGKFNCGGSIVSEHLVVTAAHCVKGYSDISIRVGSSFHSSGGKIYEINDNDIIIHEKYVGRDTYWDYDIALLRTTESLFQDGLISKAIVLPSQDQPILANTSVIASGWGRRIPVFKSFLFGEQECRSSDEDQLHAVEVAIVDHNQCNKAYNGHLTCRMICSGVPEGGKNPCFGDSGGPLVANGVLVGVVSWGRGCAQKCYPTVYANVANLRTWIRDHGQI